MLIFARDDVIFHIKRASDVSQRGVFKAAGSFFLGFCAAQRQIVYMTRDDTHQPDIQGSEREKG
jgi:hypothetical protein